MVLLEPRADLSRPAMPALSQAHSGCGDGEGMGGSGDLALDCVGVSAGQKERR